MSGEPPAQRLQQIVISPSNPQIPKGATLQLSATGVFADGSQHALAGSPTWQTSESVIAKVDVNGNVTASAQGAAQVSASYQSIKGTTAVTIGPPALASITLTANQPSLPLGESEQITATGNFSDGSTQDLTQTAAWTSSGPGVASVTPVGLVAALGVGSCTVSATSGSITGSANLAVTPAVVVSLSIVPSTVSISMGTTRQLHATATFSDGTIQDVTTSATWTSTPPTLATVNPQGSVSGVGKGSAQVSAAYQGFTATTAVNVGPPALLSITVSPNSSSLPLGESEQLTATGNYSDGSVQNLTATASWSSSTAHTSVSSSGSVLAHATGSATITATSGGISGTASISVTPAIVTAVNLLPTPVSILVNGSRQMQAIATLSDGTMQDVTASANWSSLQPGIATVNGTGLVSAMMVGSTTIVAQSSNGVTGSADLTVAPLALVNYFNLAAATTAGVDNEVQIANPGPADLCAMVYVFDQNQELNECCGCTISDDGLRTFSLVHDLAGNPLTGVEPRGGEIKIVPSDPTQNPQCNAALSTPSGALSGWATHVQVSGSASQMTETPFQPVTLTNSEATFLANMCSYLQKLGSGKGICSCGTGG